MTKHYALEVKQLSVSYDGVSAIHDMTFCIEPGKLIGIVGPNGAGKSTMIKAILELIPYHSGSVRFFNKPVKQMRKQIAYVPQRNDIDWNFPILVEDAVLLGTYPKLGLIKRPSKKDKAFASQCLQTVGMYDYRHKQISELSGGQQQRVFMARALAQEADILFLDEPFVGIDIASEKMIVDILKKLRSEGKTIFIVHHDLSKVTTYFDDVLLLNKTLIAHGPAKDVMTPQVMSEVYNMDFQLFTESGDET